MLSDPTESEKIDFPKTLDIATVCVYGLGILSAGLFLFLPFVNLLHPSPWQRWLGTIHGFGSLLALVVIVYAGHLAFPLLRGSSKLLRQMRTLTFWATVLAFLAIACTWILWKYGDSILDKANRPVLTATCIALMAMMFFAMGGLVSGLGVAKIQAL